MWLHTPLLPHHRGQLWKWICCRTPCYLWGISTSHDNQRHVTKTDLHTILCIYIRTGQVGSLVTAKHASPLCHAHSIMLSQWQLGTQGLTTANNLWRGKEEERQRWHQEKMIQTWEFALVLFVKTSKREENAEQIAPVLRSITNPNTCSRRQQGCCQGGHSFSPPKGEVWYYFILGATY